MYVFVSVFDSLCVLSSLNQRTLLKAAPNGPGSAHLLSNLLVLVSVGEEDK